MTAPEFELQGHKKYIPERNYPGRGYEAFGTGYDDLCKHCDLYYAIVNQTGLTKKPFPVRCKRHVLEEFKELKPDDFASQQEYEELIVDADPVAWSYKNFGWTARWYQEEVMSCTAQKKVVRAGRRTGKTAAIVMLILWGIYTHINWNVLVIAPFQSQVTKIFDEIEKMLALNPVLASSIKRQTKNPQRLDLVNGSKVLGFSSGAKSATKSDKVRGQDANLIVLDEADYLDDPDLEAILAILASHPDCMLWASSTPTGRHAKFYQWCTDKNLGFKEFHYVSAESPSWTEEAEDFFKTNFESVSFEHEFFAEFGLQMAGVFRNDLIDRAIVDYPLPQPRSSPYSRIVMGVDWNGEKNGVHIVITEYMNGKYKLLNKTIVKNDQFTQHKSVEAILALDKEYRCDYIYVDEGYGRVQVEMLHKVGMQNPSTGLARRVVPYAFNKNVEIRDPRKGTLTKKPSKPFLVNMTALQLEEDRLLLPLSEDTQHLVNSKEGEATGKQTGLVQQMRNFAIERISSLGLPTYTQGDDHTLFAYMLSIVGFVLEYTDLRRSNMSMSIAITRMSTGGLLQVEDHDRATKANVRQLDAGMSPGNMAKDMISTFKARKAVDALRRSMSEGNKAAIRKHFNSRNINRTGGLGKGRASF